MIERAKAILLEVLKEDDKNSEVHHTLASIYLEQGDHDRAIEHGKKAVKLNKSVADYHLLLAHSYGLKAMNSGMLGKFACAKNCKREYETTIELDSSNVEARLGLMQYCLMAPGIAGGDEDEAVRQAEIIQSLDSLSGAYAWASIWQEREDFEKAESALRQAVALDTSSTYDARFGLGYFFQQRERYAEAESTFQEILRLNPDDMRAVYQLGKTYLLAKRNLQEAERCFRQYLQVAPVRYAPSWAAAHWRLGMVFDAQGKRDDALMQLRKAVEMDHDSEQFRKTLEEVEKGE